MIISVVARKFIRDVQFYSPWRRYFFPRYSYNFTPTQLIFLCNCIEETRNVDGSIAEIGCSNGRSTIFLNKFMSSQSIEKKYYAVDTFSGFVEEDVEYEIENRDKCDKNKKLYKQFRVNKKKWFDGTLKQNKINRVESIQADVNNYDLTMLGPFSFVLLDVDLYRPIKKALKELYQVLTPGGIIVVDDCDADDVICDGADQAYKEFMDNLNESAQIVHGKLGVVRKSL